MDRSKKVPSLEDLLKELESDEKSITEKASTEAEIPTTESSGEDGAGAETEGFIHLDLEEEVESPVHGNSFVQSEDD